MTRALPPLRRIHVGYDMEPDEFESLSSALAGPVVMTVGAEPPEPARYELLVGGRPGRALLEASPDLRVLLIPYAGLPPETATLLREFPRIAVHNLHHNAAPTAEMALGLLLAAAKRIVPMDRDLRRNVWSGRGTTSPAVLLEARTALLVGFGAIGRRLAPVLRALGLTVMAVRGRATHAEEIDGTTVLPVARLRSVLPEAHIVIVCAPLTDATRGLLGRDEIALLPAGAILVNVARGPLVDEDALFEALESGALGAAGLDVWYRYPGREGDPKDTAPANRPFGTLDNVILSPHRAGSVVETEELRRRHLVASLDAAARGEPLPNRLDLDAGY